MKKISANPKQLLLLRIHQGNCAASLGGRALDGNILSLLAIKTGPNIVTIQAKNFQTNGGRVGHIPVNGETQIS